MINFRLADQLSVWLNGIIQILQFSQHINVMSNFS